MSQSETPARFVRLTSRQSVVVVALAAVALGAGCQSERELPRGHRGTEPGSSTGGGSSEGSAATPTCTNGATRDCKVTLEEQGGVVSCIAGEQVCVDGAWSECLASFSGSVPDTSSGASNGPLPGADGEGESAFVMLSGATAQACSGNSCDPSCQVFAEPGPAGPVPGCGQTAVAGGSVAALPGGFANKLLKDWAHPPSFEGCSVSADCQADHRCDPTLCQGNQCGRCVPWGEGEYDATQSLPNLTLRTPCEGSVIVCNRGGAAALPGAEVAVIAGNSSQLQANLGSCGAIKGSSKGTCAAPGAILPGQCVVVPGCPALVGTKALVVNTSAAVNNVQPESNCSDNWAIFNSSASAACGTTSSIAQGGSTYQASCPPGTMPQWGYLTYAATVPAGAKIEILVDSLPSSATPSGACEDCSVVADIPALSPTHCSAAGPSPCPISLYDALGGLPAARYATLEVAWLLTSSNTCQAPSLDSWEVTYSCVDAE